MNTACQKIFYSSTTGLLFFREVFGFAYMSSAKWKRCCAALRAVLLNNCHKKGAAHGRVKAVYFCEADQWGDLFGEAAC